MKTARVLLGATLALGLTIGLSATASAETLPTDPLQANEELAFEDQLGLLVTPEELTALGMEEEDIAKQAALFSDLSQSELDQQDELREEQAAIAELLQELPDVPVDAPNPPATGAPGVSPFIFLTWCWPGNDHYSVFYKSAGNNVVDCFAGGAGVYNSAAGGFTYTTAVRPGNHVGRVYYPSGAYWYWSPWRGKSMDTYYFTGTGVHATKVELK